MGNFDHVVRKEGWMNQVRGVHPFLVGFHAHLLALDSVDLMPTTAAAALDYCCCWIVVVAGLLLLVLPLWIIVHVLSLSIHLLLPTLVFATQYICCSRSNLS